MGLIAVVKGFERVVADDEYEDHGTDVKTDAAAKDNSTVEHFSPAGIDAPPLLDCDFVGLVEGVETGNYLAIGYIDVKNAGTATAGDVRIYSRDSAGAPVTQIVARANGEILIESQPVIVLIGSDGTVSISNNGGSFEMAADGTVSINGSNLVVLP